MEEADDVDQELVEIWVSVGIEMLFAFCEVGSELGRLN